MKKFLAILLIFAVLCTVPFAGIAYADEDSGEPGSSVGGNPEGSDPEGSDPEGGDPEGGDPEGGDPEGGDPEGGDPEGGDPEGGDPEGGPETDEEGNPIIPPFGDDITPTLRVEAPTKIYYVTGEALDFAGGAAIYTAQQEFRFNLTYKNCSEVDMTTPGNKLVTVTIHGLQASFRIVVLHADEPIAKMKDITYKHWSYPDFGPTMKAGIFAGDPDGYLHPDDPITRAEMAEIIYRSWKHDPAVMTQKVSSNPFPDVPADEWYFESVEACRKAGILRGMDTGECKPDDPILRQDAVLMLMRIQYTDEELAAINIPARVAESGVNPIDFDQVEDYAKSAMAAALGNLIKGDENRAINPRDSITRAEAAAIFHRMFLGSYDWEPPVRMPLIYLSPSNQFSNSYAAGNTTEGAQMTKLAEAVKVLLEKKGYHVVLAKRETQLVDRCTEANNMGADLYIPIHSNAGSATTGTFVFYNGSIPGCKEFSKEIFDRLAALTGTAYSANRHKEDYLCLLPDGAPFKEIKHPTMPMAYLEVEFHDKADKALWIINNTERLAQAIADGVIAYSEAHIIGG